MNDNNELKENNSNNCLSIAVDFDFVMHMLLIFLFIVVTSVKFCNDKLPKCNTIIRHPKMVL